MISAVPCASCCGMSISSTSAGIAISPPPMPSTPPMKPMRPPAARHSTMTNRFTSDPQRNLSSAASSRSTAQISRPSMGWRGALAGDQRHAEAQFGGLAQTLLSARRGPDFAGQADFAERDQSARQRPVAQRRHDGEQHRKVGRRLGDAHAADGVDEHVLVEGGHARVPVQHRQQHGQAVAFQAHGQAPRIGRVRAIHQRLDLDQQRPRAFLRGHHAGAGDLLLVLRQEQRGRIGHAAQATVGHGEHAQLVDRAEAVLERAHQPVRGMRVALEVQHRVDDVLQHARPGQRAVR